MRVHLFETFNLPPNEYVDLDPGAFLDYMADEDSVPSVYCATEKDKTSGSGFIIARYKPNVPNREVRFLDPASSTEVLVFDVDSMSPEEIEEVYPVWAECSGAIYSTWKHSEENPRLRLLIEVDRPVQNVDKALYAAEYRAVAEVLGIKFDEKACDVIRFSFGPQHRDDNADIRYRERLRGSPFPMSEIKVSPTDLSGTPARRKAQLTDDFEVTPDRPARQEISALAKSLRKHARIAHLKLASAIEAILRGDKYAPEGSRHQTTLKVTMELVKHWPQLDAEWFAAEYLEKDVWPKMYGNNDSAAMRDWLDAVDGAKIKRREEEGQRRAAAEAVARPTRAEKKLDKTAFMANATTHAGRLVVSHRGSYYVYGPYDDEFKGPFRAGELPVALRDYLEDLEGVEEYHLRKNGIVLKSATEICHEYGTTADEVIWYASKPPTNWEDSTRTLYRQAYKWIDWQPVYHEIVEDLIEAICDDERKQNEFRMYLYKFRDLQTPLPALTLVGKEKSWKSRICQILARYWTDRAVSFANKAPKALGRFNDCLLLNPTIWSDESLAVNSMGKPQPELYRESITSHVQHVEAKGVATTRLYSCVRHLISVNETDKVFTHEIDASSVSATMGRFLVLMIDKSRVDAFEAKWKGTDEMEELREGSSLLEHVMWIQENMSFASKGRLFVEPSVDRSTLLKSRFGDEVLNYIWKVAIDGVMKEQKMSVPGLLERLPLVVDEEGYLRFSPQRLHDRWAQAQAVSGAGLRKPTSQRIGDILAKAGFKHEIRERAARAPMEAWRVDTGVFKEFLEASEMVTWENLCIAFERIFGRRPV